MLNSSHQRWEEEKEEARERWERCVLWLRLELTRTNDQQGTCWILKETSTDIKILPAEGPKNFLKSRGRKQTKWWSSFISLLRLHSLFEEEEGKKKKTKCPRVRRKLNWKDCENAHLWWVSSNYYVLSCGSSSFVFQISRMFKAGFW